jgi:two-component system NtrC family response regulator
MKPRLLIVDDDEEIRSQLKWALAEEFELAFAEHRQSACEQFIKIRPLAVLLDLGLPPNPGSPEEGMASIGELVALDQQIKIIVVTGQGEKGNAIGAIGAGAYDFLSKPVDLEELRIVLRRACHVAQLEREHLQMQRRINDEGFEGMIGTSVGMQQVFTTIRKVAATDAPVLILGESGTGKEVAAQAIHHRSTRKDGPFVPINCGAIPESLLESELFGHEKGAFTGAHMQRKGRFETAHGGTLFLDEIGEMPLAVQVKLLRFLQERTIERVGGRTQIEVDARVVAATNLDLTQATKGGTFREDLFYRLAVVVVRLPALRERQNDLVLLAKSFLRRFAAQIGRENLEFSIQALKSVSAHSWPGNVRELENRIKRAVIMAEGGRVMAEDLELIPGAPATQSLRTLREAREAAEREVIEAALRRNAGKISPAAADLDISRPTLYELMEKLGISRPEREAKEAVGD